MSRDGQRGPQVSGSLGFMLVASVVLFTAAGYWLDRWLDTRPWLMVAGVFVGFGLGFTYMVLSLSGGGSSRRTREDEKDGAEGPSKGS